MQSGDNPPTLPFPLSSLLLLNAAGGGVGDFREGGFELSRYLFLGSLLLSREGGGMDLSKVGEKILSSVRSARSLGLLPSPTDRPEVLSLCLSRTSTDMFCSIKLELLMLLDCGNVYDALRLGFVVALSDCSCSC